MVQHVRNLFNGKDNNPLLQNDFNEGGQYRIDLLQNVADEYELNEYESRYYLAAIGEYGEERVYNKIPLQSSKADTESAKENIKCALKRKNETDNIKRYEKKSLKKEAFQDWIGVPTEKIISEANGLLARIVNEDGAEKNIQEPKLERIFER